MTQHSSMSGDSAHQGGKTGARELPGGHIKNKPNDVGAPALEGATPSDGVNNEGYNEIPGPLNKTPR